MQGAQSQPQSRQPSGNRPSSIVAVDRPEGGSATKKDAGPGSKPTPAQLRAAAFAKLSIRPELTLRPVLLVTRECPAALVNSRGRDDARGWTRNWILERKMDNAADGAIVNALKCKATGLLSTCRSYPKKTVEQDLLRIMRMVELNIRCQKHDGFIQLYAIVEDDNGLNIFYEPIRSDLYSLYTDPKRAESLVVEKYLVQKICLPILQSIDYMHCEQGVVHRCITSQTIFVTNEGVPKIGEFSLAICLNDQRPSSVVGKLPYLSPELLHQLVKMEKFGKTAIDPNAYDERVDVWAFGIVVFELFFGRPPYTGENAQGILDSIDRVALFASPKAKQFSSNAKDFLKQLLTEDSSERPSAAEMIDHKFISAHLTETQQTAMKKFASASKAFFKSAISFRESSGKTSSTSRLIPRKSPTPSKSATVTEDWDAEKNALSKSRHQSITSPDARMHSNSVAPSAPSVATQPNAQVLVAAAFAQSNGNATASVTSAAAAKPKSALKKVEDVAGVPRDSGGKSVTVATSRPHTPSTPVGGAKRGILKNKDEPIPLTVDKRERSVVIMSGPERSGPSKVEKSGLSKVSGVGRSDASANSQRTPARSGYSQSQASSGMVQRSAASQVREAAETNIRVQTIKPPSNKDKRRVGGCCGCFGGGTAKAVKYAA